MDVGALTPPLWGFEEREKLMVFYERVSRQRACMRPISAPAACIRTCRPACSRTSTSSAITFPKVLDDIEGLLTENRIFKQRNVDIGVVNRDEAEMWGMSGVMLRSTGVKWDLRRAQPYECYNELDFQIPVGKNGDNYDRYVMRMEEMREVHQDHEAMHREDAGRARSVAADHKIVPPRRGEMKTLDGSADPSLQALYRGLHVPAGESYAAVEAPKGEFGVYLVADGSNKPYRCKIRAPSYVHLQAMDYMCQRPHAGRRLRRAGLARHRVRGGGPVTVQTNPNIAIAQGQLDAYNAQDVDAMMAFYAPDVNRVGPERHADRKRPRRDARPLCQGLRPVSAEQGRTEEPHRRGQHRGRP